MKKPTYAELLKDPRWQKKRLELLQRSNFECQNCGETTKTLHVHHGCYLKGKKPWEYEKSQYHVLCMDCHAGFQKDLETLHSLLGQIGPWHYSNIINILIAVDGVDDEIATRNASWSFATLVGCDDRMVVPLIEMSRRAHLHRINQIDTKTKSKKKRGKRDGVPTT
jgi:hypothetical protein